MFTKSVNIIYVLCYFYEAREPFQKNLSRYNYALWWNISTDTGGHFQFRDFQLNKIIGFSLLLELYEKTFISFSLKTYIYLPAKILHITQQYAVNPQVTKMREKKIMIKF